MDELSELKKQLLLRQIYNDSQIGKDGFISNGGQIVPLSAESELELGIAIDPVESAYIDESNRLQEKRMYDAESGQRAYLEKLLKAGVSSNYSGNATSDLFSENNKKDRENVIRQYVELSDQERKKIDPLHYKM